MSKLMGLDVPAPELALRAAVVYVVVLVLLRIGGKRQLGQMGTTEFVAILLISNAVQNAMNGGDNSLLGGLLLALVLIVLSTGISLVTYRSRFFSNIFEGTPRLIVHEGRELERALRRELLSHSELHALLRKQGVQHVGEVKSAVLEADGTLSLVRYADLQR